MSMWVAIMACRTVPRITRSRNHVLLMGVKLIRR